MMGVSLAAAAVPPGSYRSFWKQLFPDVFNSFLKQALLIHRDQSLGCKLARKEEQLFSKDFFYDRNGVEDTKPTVKTTKHSYNNNTFTWYQNNSTGAAVELVMLMACVEL